MGEQSPPEQQALPAEDSVLLEEGIAMSSSLRDLQTEDQRVVLDTVSQIRKCGLDSLLSLPQIVVCGDQSAGKSSVLEALTEIPFPRNDNLCTRFATEISLRREPVTRLTIRVIPDSSRPETEKNAISDFSECITDFDQLPTIMGNAMKVMGIVDGDAPTSAFAKDTLSIEIQGPDRPQLTLVDIPGLIQTSTKGVSEADVAMVAEITNSYIEQPRTICLAVVAATHDAANQPILQRVRKYDPNGERTLGVITKPDRLSAGSGSEAKFLELARNQDVFFKLGWHVIKNRKFEEAKASIQQRHLSEKVFFSTSNFKSLPKEDLGIDTLRAKLSHLLFDHVKKELPRLRDDLENALRTAQDELRLLGGSRSTVAECRAFLAKLNMDCYEICKAGLNGDYEHVFFKSGNSDSFSPASASSIARLRAMIQHANTLFADNFRETGHKYHIMLPGSTDHASQGHGAAKTQPRALSKAEALKWVRSMLIRSRGHELVGNFNPNLIAELFWEQSERWEELARNHTEQIARFCTKFLKQVVDHLASKDLRGRIWTALVHDALGTRQQAALEELDKLIQDRRDFPLNYNHYYTNTIHKKRQDRITWQIQQHTALRPHSPTHLCSLGDHYPKVNVDSEIQKIVRSWADNATPDMEDFSCEEALDCLLAIYKVQQKTFIANVTTQVIERHIVRGLHNIFSPLVVVNTPDNKIQSVVAEPVAAQKHRTFLVDRIKKLQEGQRIFREVLEAA